MSLEGPWAQTLASPLLGGTCKFSLCPHSQLIGMCLLKAPPCFLPTLFLHILAHSDQWSHPLLDSHSVCHLLNQVTFSGSGDLPTILHSICPLPTSSMRKTLLLGLQQEPLCHLPRGWGM